MLIETYVVVKERPNGKGKMWMKFAKLECPKCGKIHRRRAADITKHRGHYCSVKCRNKHQTHNAWFQEAYDEAYSKNEWSTFGGVAENNSVPVNLAEFEVMEIPQLGQ